MFRPPSSWRGPGTPWPASIPPTTPLSWPTLPLSPAWPFSVAALAGSSPRRPSVRPSRRHRGDPERSPRHRCRRPPRPRDRGPGVIELHQVTVTYTDAPARPFATSICASRKVSWRWWWGEPGWESRLCSGHQRLVPHFTGGTLAGRVVIEGRETRAQPPRELADVVGVVGQDPMAGFVTDTVEEELAYAMEQLAVPVDVMRKRVEETLDLLGIAELRNRALHELSGGQQQRVAIGSVLTAHPRILVLDEPTSALDPTAAEEVLAAITRLVHDLGGHRGAGRASARAGRPVRRRSSRSNGRHRRVRPSGRRCSPPREWPRPSSNSVGWPGGPRCRCRSATLADRPGRCGTSWPAGRSAPRRTSTRAGRRWPHGPQGGRPLRAGGGRRGVDLDLAGGQVTALMGRNGSGKSSLLWALQGSGPRQAGTVDVEGPIRSCSPRPRPAELVGPGAPDPGRPPLPRHRGPGVRPGRQRVAACRQHQGPRALLDRLAPGNRR